jgi:hypothetical protein
MKLSEHVDKLRTLILSAFDKQFARLGIGTKRQIDLEKLPLELHAKRQRFEEMLQNHVGETGSYEKAREKLVDELTFTLFNRIAAVKVMESASLFPPIITKQTEHGDRSFGHKAWLEMRPDMRNEELEGIREYIKYAFNELGETLPLYSKEYPYALLPDTISLNEIIDAFNTVEKDPQVEDGIWQSDDILGWLYESYNNTRKAVFKESKAKTEYDKVSLQSQVYTPRWVVMFLVENSLGKFYLEMYPDSVIKKKYKIANAPNTQERKPKPLYEIKLIDPACGSGNFLLYAFDFFYALYMDQIENYGADYDAEEIPKLIIENNIHGIDLDDRAVQLAQLGLYIKARKKCRSIGSLKFDVVSSDFFLPDYEETRHIFEEGTNFDQNQKELIANIWSDLQYAYKFGSLLQIDEKVKDKLRTLEAEQSGGGNQQKLFTDKQLGIIPKQVQLKLFTAKDIKQQKEFIKSFFTNLKIAIERYARAEGNKFLASKTRDAITFLELLTTEYDVATANPPYTNSSDFGPELKTFIENNYKKPYKFHTNLYATFIKRCYGLAADDGKIAMIHPRTFMFIKTFEEVRKFILDKTHINVFVDYSLSNLFGAIMVDPAFYVLEKNTKRNKDAWFVSLDQYTRTPNEKYKKDYCLQALDDYIAGVENEHNYSIPQSKLKIIKSWPFIYWISDEFREKFGADSLDKYFNIKNGLQTGNNDRYLRFWWEIVADKVHYDDSNKWMLYGKGGPHNKWFGNLWTTVNVLETNSSCTSKGYYREGVNFSGSSSKGTSFRYMPKGNIFDNDAPLIFPKEYFDINYLLGFINTKLVSYIISCLNPTVKTQVGDIKRVPFTLPPNPHESIVSNLSKINAQIKTLVCKYSIVELDFVASPYKGNGSLKTFLNFENHILTQVLINEAIINEKIFEVYELTEHDRNMVLAKEGENIGGLPVIQEARVTYLVEGETIKEFTLDNIKGFIESLPVKEFSAEEREMIESEFPSLYQNNNDLEEFCIRHQINPINVWYWFKQSNVIPKQCMNMLAFEFLVNMIREILMEDEDGIIPLVSNAGEKVLLDRLEDKFREKGFTMAQYSGFDTMLGRPLDEYINKYFFVELSNHLNLFMYLPKTPFIWHLSSGSEHGFDCYIIIYKWSRDKLMRMRSVYIEHRERSLVNRQSDLADNNSAEAQNEKGRIFRQLKEIESFKTKIDELLAEGYNPILDDGVGKNIAPLQKKKMISYEVLNAGQLEKYLNADW